MIARLNATNGYLFNIVHLAAITDLDPYLVNMHLLDGPRTLYYAYQTDYKDI